MSLIAINTSQNVNINFNTASIGERILAFVIDILIKGAYVFTLFWFLFRVFNFGSYMDGLDNWSQMAVYIILTIPIHIYTLVSESLMEGQTFGKKLVKIKVVKIDGFQASFGDYLMRWFFRLIDVYSNSGVVGLISMIVSKNNQRLGDMASGTAVISLKNRVNISHTILENLKEDYVPLLVYHYRRYLFYAFGFFILFTLIGFISAYYDKEFVRIILGDEYVNKTIENIEKGNAVGVYQQGSNWGSAISIIFNNLKVGAVLFIYGVFGGVGTLYALLQNSIMLGAFQYFFHENGALKESASGIWLHGVFEIFSMVVEAMAGLILGASILFPKTYSRFNSFKLGFKDAFKIFLSTVPFTIVAGIIEGYVTRYALVMPGIINGLLIFGTLSLICYYYFIYPYLVAKKSKIHDAILSETGLRPIH